MTFTIFSNDVINTTSDITACVFMMMLVVSIAVKSEKRREPGHLLAASIMTLQAMLLRLFASTIESMPAGVDWDPAGFIFPVTSAPVVRIMSFVLIVIGVTEAATFSTYINVGRSRSNLRMRYASMLFLITAGTAAYLFTGSINVLSFATLALISLFIMFLHRKRYESAFRAFGRAATPAVITLILPFFFDNVRLTGAGLFLMLLIMNEQYHVYLERELAENEEALAQSKVQLLAEQISPHYIYNALQSIRDLCDTDPAKAKDTIDSFSEYLRGNLESLTVEQLIPFIRELEITQAYLDLEKLTWRGQFELEYHLETTDFMLPPLVLQPVVENAVKYGTYLAAKDRESGFGSVTEIVIATRQAGEAVIIEVTNKLARRFAENAEQPEAANKSHTPKTAINRSKKRSVGLENVRTRLAIQCGGTLEMKTLQDGAAVTITLPHSVALSEKNKRSAQDIESKN